MCLSNLYAKSKALEYVVKRKSHDRENPWDVEIVRTRQGYPHLCIACTSCLILITKINIADAIIHTIFLGRWGVRDGDVVRAESSVHEVRAFAITTTALYNFVRSPASTLSLTASSLPQGYVCFVPSYSSSAQAILTFSIIVNSQLYVATNK